MNLKRVIYVALLCLLILGVFFAGSRIATPRYKGRTLSEWLDAEPNFPPSRTRSVNEWKNAIRKLGPGALLDLAAELDQDPWLTSQKVLEIRRFIPKALQLRKAILWLSKKAEQNEIRSSMRAAAAETALRLLGPQAQPVLPELFYRFSHPRNWASVYRTGSVLAEMGPCALPELLRTLSNPQCTNARAIIEVISRMHDIGQTGTSAVPALCRHLQQGDPALRVTAATALGALRVGPDLAVPALCRALTNSLVANWSSLSRKCAEVLGRYGKNASNAVPTLCLALTSSDGITTEEAARALGLIGTSGELAVPALIRYLQEGDRRHRKYAIEGLKGYDRASREAMPLLEAVLNDENHDARSAAAELIEQLNRAN